MKIKRKVILEKPKQKPFVRGGFYYNPEVDPETWRGCRSEATQYIAKTTDVSYVSSLTSRRALYARLERRARERLRRGA
jgi:hypothetical protein